MPAPQPSSKRRVSESPPPFRKFFVLSQMGKRDDGLDYLLADWKASGLSVREYEKLYGIRLMPSERAAASHEVPLDEARGSRPAHCPACARKAEARRPRE